MCTVFLLDYRNTSGSFGEQEMLWEHESSVSTSFWNSPKISRVFLQLGRNTENMISVRKYRYHRKENNLFTLIIKMLILFARTIITSTACTNSVFVSSCRNTIFIQLVRVFSLVYFLIKSILPAFSAFGSKFHQYKSLDGSSHGLNIDR